MHEQTQSPAVEGHHLMVGLGNHIVPNPVEVARLLLDVSSLSSSNRHISDKGELLNLNWQDSGVDFLPNFGTNHGDLGTPENNRWSCRCTRLTIDEMLQLNMARMRDELDPLMLVDSNINDDYDIDKYKHLLPSSTSQLRESGCKMTRKKLLQRVELTRKLRNLKCCNKFAELHNDCLYELESLVYTTNSWLASLLEHVAEQDLQQLLSILSNALNDARPWSEDSAALWDHAIEGGLPIGTRPPTIQYYCNQNGPVKRKLSMGSSEDSGISLIVSLTTTGDNDLEHVPESRPKLAVAQKLEICLRFRSCVQSTKIIKFSCQLFRILLVESRLLRLEVTDDNAPISLNQLRLNARVECQKLRASLRFEWLAKCMWLALDDGEQLLTARHNLPPVCATQDEVEYLNAIARLMGYLLRKHFLEQALELWIAAVERELTIQTLGNHSTRLSISVDLVDNQELQVSRPEMLLKETLSFVCDELVSTCSHLPRIESQFSPEGSLNEEITILTFGDNLLDDKKTELAHAIDAAINAWISPEYLRVVEVINNFRSGNYAESTDGAEPRNSVRDLGINLIGLEICSDAHMQDGLPAHAAHLELTCRHVNLLNQLEQQLRCHLKTEINFGQLVQLDLLTLNERLTRIVVRERLLLIRLQADELFRLMDKLRLQFDELEINIDLETAIEDYLNERWQVKQSQQPDLEQQILLADDNEDNIGPTTFDYDLPPNTVEPEPEDKAQAAANETVSGVSGFIQEEDEFLQALVSNNNPNVAHLFAMSNPTGSVPPEQEQHLGRRQGQSVAPLIESRLLLERYRYLNRFVREELSQFICDLTFLLTHGLSFLSEISPRIQDYHHNEPTSSHHQLESEQLELLAEISLRTREFSILIREALSRLEQTSGRLINLANLRANVLSRTLLEFNWLMIKLGQRRLESLAHDSSDLNMKQLDFIQETSSWSQRLETRWEFLTSQNDLLRRELTLLLVDRKRELEELATHLPGATEIPVRDISNHLMDYELEFQVRAGTLQLWATYTKQVNEFWRLIEDFETQQVKWLNSDAKKLNYEQVARAFEQNFVAQFTKLQSEVFEAHKQVDQAQVKNIYRVLLENLEELSQRLERFRRVCLPIFKFLTNKHLTHEHWTRLSELIATTRSKVTPDTDQVYTTVAQLLEQLDLTRSDLQLSQLDIMSHEATREHELSQLIAKEVARREIKCQSLKSQLESLEVSTHLDTWSDRELATAASRFIKVKLDPYGERATMGAIDIDELARKLVGCHSAARRYRQLRGDLNLDLPAIPKKEKQRLKQVVVLRPRQYQVDGALLVEFLRLFTSSWLEREARLAAKSDKVKAKLTSGEQHLGEIEDLLEKSESLQTTDLEVATREGERQLALLQRESLRMDMEREILATRESAALERQREALRARDICVRQVSERAVPALRAATKALDCLGDGRSALRALRSYRPCPPLAVRLVIEAVCLLRNVCSGQPETKNLADLISPSSHKVGSLEGRKIKTPCAVGTFPASPERRFDAAKGQIVEDYWPIAWRTLNGTHSSQFIADLRQVGKRTIPGQVMLNIRRKYLSRPELKVAPIRQISREAALLARWLIAVDVFDRVLNIVRPNHEEYLRAEESLTELQANVSESRRKIDTLSRELEQLEESIGVQVKRRAALVDLIDDCRTRSGKLNLTRGELLENIARLRRESTLVQMKMNRVAHRCLWDSARLVYVQTQHGAERDSIANIIDRELST